MSEVPMYDASKPGKAMLCITRPLSSKPRPKRLRFRPQSSEHGTYKAVKARFGLWLVGQSPEILLARPQFARMRLGAATTPQKCEAVPKRAKRFRETYLRLIDLRITQLKAGES